MADLTQFAVGAQNPPPTSTERSLFELIQLHTQKLRQAVDSGRVPPGELQLRVAALHSNLVKVYGKGRPEFVSLSPKGFQGLKTQDEILEFTGKLVPKLEAIVGSLEDAATGFLSPSASREKIFIGHGRSPLWRELKDFIQDRLGLPWDEFNREAVAGYSTFERLSDMLSHAKFAFLIMTAEDEHTDSSLHARENVVHEVGLFQGKLGPRKAIIFLEDGCKEFSNITGLCQIRFPRGHVSAAFEEIRRVLEREGIV